MYYTLGWGLAGLLEVEGNNFIGTSQYALGGIDPS
jgi:hypothetical protein